MYYNVELPDGTFVKIRKTRLKAVKRDPRTRDDSRNYGFRKALFSDHIPAVRRRRERKCQLHEMARRHIPSTRGESPLPRTFVSEIQLAALGNWSGKGVKMARPGYMENKPLSQDLHRQ